MPSPFELFSHPTKVENVTAHATNPLPGVGSLWVGTGGDLVVRAVGSAADATIPDVPSGCFIPGQFTHVRDSSTASGLVLFHY